MLSFAFDEYESFTVNEKTTNLLPGTQSSPGKTMKRSYDSQELFRGRQEILIEHSGDAYRLRITRQGKLILTK